MDGSSTTMEGSSTVEKAVPASGSAVQRKKKLKMKLVPKRKFYGGLNGSIMSCRNTSLNSTVIKMTLRANNRALAQALEQKKKELAEAHAVILSLKTENQSLFFQLRSLNSMNGGDIEKEINRRTKTKLQEVQSSLIVVSSALMSGVNQLALAMDLCSDGALRRSRSIAASAVLEASAAPRNLSKPATFQLNTCSEPSVDSVAKNPVIKKSKEALRVARESVNNDDNDDDLGTEAIEAEDAFEADAYRSEAAVQKNNLSMIAEQSCFIGADFDTSLSNSESEETSPKDFTKSRRNTVIYQPAPLEKTPVVAEETSPKIYSVERTLKASRGRTLRRHSSTSQSEELNDTLSEVTTIYELGNDTVNKSTKSEAEFKELDDDIGVIEETVVLSAEEITAALRNLQNCETEKADNFKVPTAFKHSEIVKSKTNEKNATGGGQGADSAVDVRNYEELKEFASKDKILRTPVKVAENLKSQKFESEEQVETPDRLRRGDIPKFIPLDDLPPVTGVSATHQRKLSNNQKVSKIGGSTLGSSVCKNLEQNSKNLLNLKPCNVLISKIDKEPIPAKKQPFMLSPPIVDLDDGILDEDASILVNSSLDSIVSSEEDIHNKISVAEAKKTMELQDLEKLRGSEDAEENVLENTNRELQDMELTEVIGADFDFQKLLENQAEPSFLSIIDMVECKTEKNNDAVGGNAEDSAVNRTKQKNNSQLEQGFNRGEEANNVEGYPASRKGQRRSAVKTGKSTNQDATSQDNHQISETTTKRSRSRLRKESVGPKQTKETSEKNKTVADDRLKRKTFCITTDEMAKTKEDINIVSGESDADVQVETDISKKKVAAYLSKPGKIVFNADKNTDQNIRSRSKSRSTIPKQQRSRSKTSAPPPSTVNIEQEEPSIFDFRGTPRGAVKKHQPTNERLLSVFDISLNDSSVIPGANIAAVPGKRSKDDSFVVPHPVKSRLKVRHRSESLNVADIQNDILSDSPHGIMLALGNGKRVKPRARSKAVRYAQSSTGEGEIIGVNAATDANVKESTDGDKLVVKLDEENKMSDGMKLKQLSSVETKSRLKMSKNSAIAVLVDDDVSVAQNETVQDTKPFEGNERNKNENISSNPNSIQESSTRCVLEIEINDCQSPNDAKLKVQKKSVASSETQAEKHDNVLNRKRKLDGSIDMFDENDYLEKNKASVSSLPPHLTKIVAGIKDSKSSGKSRLKLKNPSRVKLIPESPMDAETLDKNVNDDLPVGSKICRRDSDKTGTPAGVVAKNRRLSEKSKSSASKNAEPESKVNPVSKLKKKLENAAKIQPEKETKRKTIQAEEEILGRDPDDAMSENDMEKEPYNLLYTDNLQEADHMDESSEAVGNRKRRNGENGHNSSLRSVDSIDSRLSTDMKDSRRSRRGAAVSYKEPSLGAKLRRGDPHTVSIYSGKDVVEVPAKKDKRKSKHKVLASRDENVDV